MVNTLVSRLPGYARVICSAPTNKAVRVLKSKVDEASNIEFLSTHQALKMKMFRDYKTGAVSFRPAYKKGDPPLKGVKYLIVDETSMLNSELLEYIEEFADNHNTKVIFIGDSKQLPPVGEKESPVFLANYPEIELTEIIRQGEGNTIITLSRNLKSISSGVDAYEVKNEVPLGYMFSNDRQKVIDTLAGVNGSTDLKYLAWTNKEVDLMNFLVRNRIYGNPRKIEIGEVLVFNTPYEDYIVSDEVKVENLEVLNSNFRYTNDKYGKIKPDLGEDAYYGNVELKFYMINGNIKVIHEESEKKLEKLKKHLKYQAKTASITWDDYAEFFDTFADLKYNHALTIHKAQGSGYQQVILNVKNMKLNRDPEELQRLLYTGVTRTEKLLILYNY